MPPYARLGDSSLQRAKVLFGIYIFSMTFVMFVLGIIMSLFI